MIDDHDIMMEIIMIIAMTRPPFASSRDGGWDGAQTASFF
jgi:hypothetical protein